MTQQDRPRRRRKQDSGIDIKEKKSKVVKKERPAPRQRNKGQSQKNDSRKENYPRFLRGKNGEFQHFRVSRDALPGTPIGRPRVTGLSRNGALVTWELRHRYRRGGNCIKI